MMGEDFDNPWGKKTPKGVVKKMSQLLDSAVFPGNQGGPLEHVIAAKAVAFGEILLPSWKEYATQVKKKRCCACRRTCKAWIWHRFWWYRQPLYVARLTH